jgi:hypothetical protein
VPVSVVVVLGEKTGIPIVAALHDVQRNAGKMEAGAARHEGESRIIN